jgi:hypothetical protein
MRHSFFGAAVLVLVLAVPASAATVSGTPADQARVQRYLPIAQAYWPGSGCAGREAIDVVEADSLILPDEGERGRGWAAQATCSVTLIDTLTDAWLCTVLAHELGHLAGRQHTELGFMSAGGGRVPTAECLSAAAVPTSRARSRRRAPTRPERAGIARAMGMPGRCLTAWVSAADRPRLWALIRRRDLTACPQWNTQVVMRRRAGWWYPVWQGSTTAACPILRVPAAVQSDLRLCP